MRGTLRRFHPGEKGSGDFKSLGNTGQTTGSYAIAAVFIFLHLLKGHADLCSQFGLRQTLRQALRAHAAAHLGVAVIRPSVWFGFRALFCPKDLALTARGPQAPSSFQEKWHMGGSASGDIRKPRDRLKGQP